MSNGEIISLIAVSLSFLGVLTSFVFSYRKATRERDQERENSLKNTMEIRNNMAIIKTSTDEIKYKVEKIDIKIQTDHERLIEHEQKIRNLEKEVFKGGAD